jgi:hypothetical protein
MRLFTIILLIYLTFPVHAKRLHPEKWYQNQWCVAQNGKSEVVLEDRTRCDCLTTTHAIEFDFANKWYSAIGQSLHYALLTNKRAGIVLILESENDKKYLDRLNRVIERID